MSIVDFNECKSKILRAKNCPQYQYEDALFLCGVSLALLRKWSLSKGIEDISSKKEYRIMLSDMIYDNLDSITEEWKFARATPNPNKAFQNTAVMQALTYATKVYDIVMTLEKK